MLISNTINYKMLKKIQKATGEKLSTFYLKQIGIQKGNAVCVR